MTLERDAVSDLFGLCGSFPLPGWAILDAARAHRFTGELTFDVRPAVRLYLDRGRIYLAERVTDPPLGDRLVDSGALTPVQLAHGALRVGETEHLGRLFERVPAIDREIVMLTTELMNDTCVAWVAGQEVPSVLGTPYLHHPSGIHRWDRPADAVDLTPGDPLPAPAPTDIPLPTPDDPIPDADPLISWDLSSWLDERTADAVAPAAPSQLADQTPPPDVAPLGAPPLESFDATPPPLDPAPDQTACPTTSAPISIEPAWTEPPSIEPAWTEPVPTEPVSTEPVSTEPPDPATSILGTDWADRLESDGLPPVGDPLTAPAQLPPVHVEHAERFELIWPSGEVDEEFGAVAAVEGDRGQDRVGPTARVVRTVDVLDGPEQIDEPPGLWDFETTGPMFGPVATPPAAEALTAAATDEAVLSMRQAIDAIEADAQAKRVDTAADASAPLARLDAVPELDVPGRVATRSESSVWTVPASDPNRMSVFDEVTADAAVDHTIVAGPMPDTARDPEPGRVSALRRLIGGLRLR